MPGPSLEDFRAAKEAWSSRLLVPSSMSDELIFQQAQATPVSPDPGQNVVGVGIGEKIVNGKPDGSLTIKFLVQVKYPRKQIKSKYLLPRTIDGLPVDVEQVGRFRALSTSAGPNLPGIPNPRVKIRPACSGCSIGFQAQMAGTFGAVVEDDTNTYILSNNHVLADRGNLPLGSPIFSPALLDNGDPKTDKVAELAKFISFDANGNNKVDCALARTDKSLVSNTILHIGSHQGYTAAAMNMSVHKFGRTTEHTVGRVTSIDTDVKVGYGISMFIFEEQIIIDGSNNLPFADLGDSGSLILERQSQYVIGLLFATSTASSYAVANHIGDVLGALNVRLT